MLKNVYEGLNARSNVYFCEVYATCVSSKLAGLLISSCSPDPPGPGSNDLQVTIWMTTGHPDGH